MAREEDRKFVMKLDGKRGKMITGPRKGEIVFDAIARPSRGGDLKAQYRLKL